MSHLKLLPALPPERCRHERTELWVRDSETLGGGPSVAVRVLVCRECRWSWIERKVR